MGKSKNEKQLNHDYPIDLTSGVDEVKESESKLVVVVVKKGFAYQIIKIANDNGAKGAFILDGRGSSQNKKRFLGLDFAPEKEVVMMVVDAKVAYPVVKSIYAIEGFRTTIKGFVFALPVSMVLD